MLALVGGGLAAPVTALVSLPAKNALVVVTPAAAPITLSLKATTGFFSGSYSLPNATRPTAYKGVIFQKQQVGAGFFHGTGVTGEAGLTPVP